VRPPALVVGRHGADRRGDTGPGATVSAVARRHDIRPQQLFGWRREMMIPEPEPPMAFVPALVEEPEKPGRARPKLVRSGRGDIELEIDGMLVRVRSGVEARTVAAVIKALKATR
jgi:transposase